MKRARKEHPVLAEPLAAGSVLRGTFRLLWEAAGSVLAVVLLFQVPWAAIAVWTHLDEAEALEQLRWSGLWELFFGTLGSATIALVAFGVLTRDRPGIGAALGGAVRVWGPLLLASILSGLWVLVLLVLGVVPGILRALSYAIVTPVVALERQAGRRRDPLHRSSQLMFGNRRAAALPLLVLYLLSGVPTFAVLVLQSRLGRPVFHFTTEVLNGVFGAPFEVGLVVLYVKAKRSHDATLGE